MSAAQPEQKGFPEENIFPGWTTLKRKTVPEPFIQPLQTLQQVLEHQDYIDYGLLKNYDSLQHLDPHGVIGAKLVQKIKLNGKPLSPYLQADLLVRYIMEKAKLHGENGNTYTANIYQIPHMTREFSQAGYSANSDRLQAWEKLMKADHTRQERQTLRRGIHRL